MPVLHYARESKRSHWVAGAVVVGLFFVFVGYDFWKRNYVPAGTPCRTRILAVDAATGLRLNPTVVGPALSGPDPSQMTFTSFSGLDGMGIQVSWVYTGKSCPITVEVRGYQKVELLLTPNSPQDLTVQLKKR